MRIIYDPAPNSVKAQELADDGTPPFGFRVTPERRRRLGAVKSELHGLATIEGRRVAIRELTISGDDVSSTMLREAPLGELRRQLHADVQSHPDLLAWAASGIVSLDDRDPFALRPATASERRAAQAEARRAVKLLRERVAAGGRKGYDDRFLENIAVVYIKCSREDARRPADLLYALMRQARSDLKPATVRKWITKARAAGWLAPATQGRAVAAAGPRLIEKSRTEGSEDHG